MSKTQLPSFEWLKEFAPFSTVPLLKITFPDGNEDDFAVLRSFNPVPAGPEERDVDIDPCIFEGNLVNEPESQITLTGCPFTMNFEVTLNLCYEFTTNIIISFWDTYRFSSPVRVSTMICSKWLLAK